MYICPLLNENIFFVGVSLFVSSTKKSNYLKIVLPGSKLSYKLDGESNLSSHFTSTSNG